MTRHALVLLAVALSPACSLLVKSDDLIGGSSAVGGEAGAGAEGGADADVGADADAVSPSDGGARCQGTTVCDDFEGAGTIGWRPVTTGNASIVVDGVKPRAGARSLHASRAAVAGRDAAYYEFTPAGTLRFCELDVFAASSDYLSVFNFGFGAVDAPFTSYSLSMQMGGSLAQFGGKGSSPALYTDVYVGALALSRWVHVRIDFDWTPASPALLLSVDGAAQPRFPITPPTGSKPFVQMGMTYSAAQGTGWDVFVDNVACSAD